jgi:hypothetical protein
MNTQSRMAMPRPVLVFADANLLDDGVRNQDSG